jgi:hypothetical protein
MDFKEYVREFRGLSDVQTNCLEQLHAMHLHGMEETDERYIKAKVRFEDAAAKLAMFLSENSAR